jgi:hypothetical protein
MKFGPGWCCLAALALVSCGGTSGSSSVSGTDPASIKAAPAGLSTTVFMDLERVRPDSLATGTGLPSGVTPNFLPVPLAQSGTEAAAPAVLTFTNCRAANGGYINGTIGLAVSGTTTLTYVETFNLTVTPTAAPVSGTPAWTWTYKGTQTVTVTPATSNATVSPAITATYTAGTATPKVYLFSGALAVNWASPQAVSLIGTYEVALTGIESVAVTLGPALVWDTTASPSCAFPKSGTLTLVLDLVSPAFHDSTSVVFNAPCGAVSIGGANLNLGQ